MPKCPTLSGSLCLTLCDNIRIPFQSSSSNSALLYAYNAGPCSHKPLVCHKHTHARTHTHTHTHTVSCCLSSHVFHSCWISRLDSDPKIELLQIIGTSFLQVANHSCQRWKRNLNANAQKNRKPRCYRQPTRPYPFLLHQLAPDAGNITLWSPPFFIDKPTHGVAMTNPLH